MGNFWFCLQKCAVFSTMQYTHDENVVGLERLSTCLSKEENVSTPHFAGREEEVREERTV